LPGGYPPWTADDFFHETLSDLSDFGYFQEMDRKEQGVDALSEDRSGKEASAQFIGHLIGAQRHLCAFVYSLVPHPADAEDILQETNLVLWRKANKFQPGTDFLAWAFQVARYQVMALRKRQQRSREYFDDELIQMLTEEAIPRLKDSDRRYMALFECLKRLRPDVSRLLAQRYEPGGSVNEIARQAGRSPNAISAILSRAREGLLRCIEHRLATERD
jgi:RNA polymerase sigma-70 factor (ECF subfamily)